MSRKELNDVTITSKFDEASTRENLVSGETIGKHFGKIKKFFSDLKPIAFSGSYSDLSNTPTVDSTLSDTSTNAIQNKAVNSALLKKSNSGHTHDDRYYTETEIDTKLKSKSDTTHTHTKSDITDFPTSMPANGGNSTTVNDHTVNANVPANAKFTDTTYDVFGGASSTANGTKGLVPAPTKGNDGLFLRSNGTWGTPTGTKYTLGSFGIAASATELNYTKGVTSAIQTQLNSKAASNHTHTTVNGHTVNSNVPANAKFTDTVVSVIDNLSSTSTTAALSAAQGKELTNIIGSLYSNVVFNTFKFNFTSTFTNNGITFRKLSDAVLLLQGTATSDINYDIGSFLFDKSNDKFIYFLVSLSSYSSSATNKASFELLFTDNNDNTDVFPYEIEDDYACIDISGIDVSKDNTSVNIIINSGTVMNGTLQFFCVPMTTDNVKINMKDVSIIPYSSTYSSTNSIIKEICSNVEKTNISAGSSTQPVYFSNGTPVACKYTLGASVPSNAKFTDTVTTIVNSCDSDSTTSALSAAQGKSLKTYIDAVNTNAGNMSNYLNSFKQTGVVICSSTANTPTTTHVNFTTKMNYVPLVFLNPLTTVPGTILKGCSATNITQTGFDIYITRSDGWQTSVKWLAIY